MIKLILLKTKLYPEKLRTRMMLLAISLVCISTFTIAYLVEKQGKDLLLQEKEQKLLAVAHILDVELEDLFMQRDKSLSREQQIKWLNQKIAPRLERFLATTPKIGAGYYNKELDAIIAYAPQKDHGDKIGVTIDDDHPGREVMRIGKALVWEGQQVRGNILNGMVPIIRNNEVQGYIWANELVNDIKKQTMALDKNIIIVCLAGLFSSILLTSLLSHRLNSDIDVIKEGLRSLPFNLHTKLPPLRGEMNEIVHGVNHLSSALNEAKSINEMILDSMIDGVITVDNNAYITMLNPAAEKIIGYRLDQVIGQPYETILDDKSYKSPLLDTLHNGTDHIGLEMDFPVSGKVVKISSSTSHLKNHSGEIIGAVVIFKDLTEQKEMQRVIQQTERLVAVGELMAGVAHEIRNPLAAIRGFVQYLQQAPDEKEQKEYIDIILKEVDSINKVIQQLLDLSSPPKHYFASTSLNKLVKDTLLLVKTLKTSSQINFILNLDEDLGDIYLDKGMMKQTLLNLIINAIQATGESGTIRINTGLTNDNIPMQYIEIHDSGHGLSEEAQEKIFTPFFTTKLSGTGLGLSIAQKVINSHEGVIQIYNHDDAGVAVVIKLPIS